MLTSMLVNGECIKKEKTYTNMGNANKTLSLIHFRMNGALRNVFKSNPDVFKVSFVAGDSFSASIKYQFDTKKYNVSEPGVDYNETALATSLELSTIVASSGLSAIKGNSIVSALMTSAAIAKMATSNRLETLMVAGMIAAAISNIPTAYAADDACPLYFEVTITYVPGRWRNIRKNIKDRANGKDTDGEIDYTPDE